MSFVGERLSRTSINDYKTENAAERVGSSGDFTNINVLTSRLKTIMADNSCHDVPPLLTISIFSSIGLSQYGSGYHLINTRLFQRAKISDIFMADFLHFVIFKKTANRTPVLEHFSIAFRRENTGFK